MPGTGTPADARNLPEDYYGGFDVRPTPDGGKRYRLPHTLYGTVMAIVTGVKALAVVAGLTGGIAVSFGIPISSNWLGTAIVFLAVHAALAILVTLWALLTGYRCATFITIRPDGLVWNDRAFFSARHIWMIHYGTTTNEGKASEVFEPLLEIQVGTKTVLLADNLDPVAAKMFMHLFRDDTRRYWHGHN